MAAKVAMTRSVVMELRLRDALEREPCGQVAMTRSVVMELRRTADDINMLAPSSSNDPLSGYGTETKEAIRAHALEVIVAMTRSVVMELRQAD